MRLKEGLGLGERLGGRLGDEVPVEEWVAVDERDAEEVGVCSVVRDGEKEAVPLSVRLVLGVHVGVWDGE